MAIYILDTYKSYVEQSITVDYFYSETAQWVLFDDGDDNSSTTPPGPSDTGILLATYSPQDDTATYAEPSFTVNADATVDVGSISIDSGTFNISGDADGEFDLLPYISDDNVYGPPSYLNVTGSLTGAVTIDGNATVANSVATIDGSADGWASVAYGTITVDGALTIEPGVEAQVYTGGLLEVGGAFTLKDGSSLLIDGAGSELDTTGTIVIGDDSASFTLVNLVNDWSWETNDAEMIIGEGATSNGSLYAEEGQLDVSSLIIGDAGSGSATFSAASTVSVSDDVIVGEANSGDGNLELAAVDPTEMTVGRDFVVGEDDGSSGSATIEGPGTSLTVAHDARIGEAGIGSIEFVQDSIGSIKGDLDVGVAATGVGTAAVEAGATLGVDGEIDIGGSGSGAFSVVAGGAVNAKDDVYVGGAGSGGGYGTLTVDGDDTTFTASNLTVGGLTPASVTGNGQDGNWIYSGGAGALEVSDVAAVTISGALKLQDYAEIGAGGSLGADGGISIASGGSLEIGGGGGAPADTLQIAAGGSLTGHGEITGAVTGEVPVAESTTAPTYSLSIDNAGTIDADDGLLKLDGNVSGDGRFLIGPNSTLEFGGAVDDDVTVMFLPGGDETLVIDDPEDFKGVVSSENFEPGDAIDLSSVPYISPGPGDNNPDGASFYLETGEGQQDFVLQVVENNQTYDIPISEDDDELTGGFTLSDDGHGGTLVTYSDDAVTGYSVAASADGQEISSYDGVVRLAYIVSETKTTYTFSAGSGFAVGPNLILTAYHVVRGAPTLQKPQVINVYLPSGGGRTLGYVMQHGASQNRTDIPSDTTSGDWAYVFTPDHTFSPWEVFSRDAAMSPGDHAGIIVTGYPNENNIDSIESVNQYSKKGWINGPVGSKIEYGSGFRPILDSGIDFLSNGYSGGPTWTYNGVLAKVVGINDLTKFALNIATVPTPHQLGLADTVYKRQSFFDPPANGANITSAVVVQTGEVDAGQVVQFVLDLSENVIVTGGGPTLSLNDGGVATYNAANSTGTALEFDYTVGVGDQTSNLEITGVNSADTVQAPGGASIDFSVIENLPTGLSINSPLTVTSVAASPTGEVNAGASVQLTLTMSEAVTVNTAGGAPSLLLNDNAIATYDAVASNAATGKLVFDYTVGADDEIANLEIASVDLPTGTTITDAAGDNADFSAADDAPTGLQVGPAYITAITPSRTSELTTGETLRVTLAMSQGVTVDTSCGSPALSLSDGAQATYDAAASNPSAGNLVFDYTVGAGDYTTDLQILGYNPNGATVTDAHGVGADFSGAADDNLALDVNAAVVAGLAVSPSAGEVDSGHQVTLTLTMNEPVVVDLAGGSPTLSLDDGATATYAAAASDPAAGSLVFDYTVGPGDETPSLQISAVNLDGATIDDSAGHAADLSAADDFTTDLQIGPAFVGSLTPSLSGEIFTGQTDQFTLTMSQAVTVDAANGPPTLSLSDGAVATYDAAASNPADDALVFDYTVGAGDYATDLTVLGYNANGATVTDANGVAADFSAVAGDDLYLDVNAAIVTNVTSSPSSGEADSGAAVAVTLTMNEAVTVDTTNGSPSLNLSTGATATYDSAASDPSAGSLVFDYAVGATDETPDLQVIQANLNGATIDDADGHPADLSAAGDFDTGLQIGPVFVEEVTPSLSGDITTGQTVQLAVSMSAPLTVDTAGGSPTLSLSDGAFATYDAAASSPADDDLVFDYTVEAGDYATDLSVTAFNADGASVTDANGVSPDISGLASSDLGLDVNAATVTNVVASPSTGPALNGQPVLLTLTMSEPVTVDTSGGSPTLYLSDGAVAAYDPAASNPAAGTLAFDFTVGRGDTTPDLAITQVNLNGAAVTDGMGNPPDFSAALGADTGLEISAAYVAGVAASRMGDATTGQTVQLSLAFSEGVSVDTSGGLPTLQLNDGAVATYDAAASAPIAGLLAFDTTVGASDQTPDLEVSAVDIPTGSGIRDIDGVSVDVSAASDAPTGLSINSPLTVASVSTSLADLASSDEIQFTLHMAEAVVDDAIGNPPTLTLDDGSSANFDAGASDLATGSLVFDDFARPTDSTANLAISSVNVADDDTTLRDENGYNADFSAALGQGTGIAIVAVGDDSTGASLASGAQLVFGTADDAMVGGDAVQYVLSGGVANGTQVSSGGRVVVAAGGAIHDATISGGDLDLSPGAIDDAITFVGSGGVLDIDGLAQSGAVISGFAAGDAIDLTSLPFVSGSSTYSVSAGAGADDWIVTVNEGGQSQSVEFYQTTPVTTSEFTLSPDGTQIEMAGLCYLAGTRILTPTGEAEIETLRVGDRVVTRFGGVRPILWIGRQSFGARFIAGNLDKIPVRVRAGALGARSPARDLYISPGHSMLIDGRLALAKDLVNGATITQEPPTADVHYFQIELESHDCVIAESAWSETFADAPGLRDQFHNAAEFWRLYPDHVPADTLKLCAPRPERGPEREALLRPIAARAAAGRAPGPLRGSIDAVIDARRIEGWAQDVAHPEMPVDLEIWLGDARIGSALACERRWDLAEARIGRGHQAFDFTSPRPLASDELPTLRVRRAGDGAEIFMSANCAARLRAEAARPALRAAG